ncbi:MAG: GTPase HflX [Gammaproteobacteria bacterium]|nr:GTPase HflX [Gammaproteobacteria bacterium]
MFDRYRGGDRAVLVHIEFSGEAQHEELAEFGELVRSAGVERLGLVTGSRQLPDPKLFVGTGKADEIKAAVEAAEAELVIFNHALTPGQERNLERHLQCRVVDRTGLILDIFAQRARTFEGKLQVELAHLRHMSTRLVRGWTHLERQRGGIGLRGGMGETQLEIDRRILRQKIDTIQKRLEKVERQRAEGRKARLRNAVPTVSLVGYTNAGKSTLFNTLTHAQVYAADQLFATLDPTLRALELPGGAKIILADTVGFIRHLPHELVAAFRATLEETREADLLVHVIDAADENAQRNIEQVDIVLEEIGATEAPRLMVMNKIDRLDATPRLERDEQGLPWRVWISAKERLGLDILAAALAELTHGDAVQETLVLEPRMGRLRGQLYDLNAVQEESLDEDGHWLLRVVLPREELHKVLRREGLNPRDVGLVEPESEADWWLAEQP